MLGKRILGALVMELGVVVVVIILSSGFEGLYVGFGDDMGSVSAFGN